MTIVIKSQGNNEKTEERKKGRNKGTKKIDSFGKFLSIMQVSSSRIE